MRIEDYALIGDTHTAALVGRNGSIDWLCLPRFDSGSCFAALLGNEDHGFWILAPVDAPTRITRRYRPGTLVLETDFETAGGAVRVIDCMPIRQEYPWLVRRAVGLRGRVPMRMKLVIRFDYGAVLPWVHKTDHSLEAKAGPDAVILRTRAATRGEGFSTVAEFELAEGEDMPFGLHWYPSHQPPPPPGNVHEAIESTTQWWQEWSQSGNFKGDDRDAVHTSARVLKALTYAPTGGIVAAATTSLPESLGGERNWDYRFCWLRDAAFTLDALLAAGYADEAESWRDWLLRAIAGDPAALQTLYGTAGERRAPEFELTYLPGYENSRPVRIGNLASTQFQLDVYGEVIDALYRARLSESVARENSADAWSLQIKLMEYLEKHWRDDDSGIWEVRGEVRPFTYSKVMAWVAADRTVKAAEKFGLECDRDHWAALRDEIRQDVLSRGFNPKVNAFTQSYGSDVMDAAVLRLPMVGFIDAKDPRMLSTIAAVEKKLLKAGLVARYEDGTDNLGGVEGVFLPCSFWLVVNFALCGRVGDARKLYDTLISLANDLGLFSEEYDPQRKRLLGNFPQAFTHVALINAAVALAEASR
ncbi:MAG TPA: glycoside hydrolase family 15 protein [Opitutaceae bacterium]|jgi:GH15 family glucan-1,4-alpha-glucosidase|nr:glycoside hydrolase family 15 protein [Opitutaceae bacterium]